jgi:hypothetical protein
MPKNIIWFRTFWVWGGVCLTVCIQGCWMRGQVLYHRLGGVFQAASNPRPGPTTYPILMELIPRSVAVHRSTCYQRDSLANTYH